MLSGGDVSSLALKGDQNYLDEDYLRKKQQMKSTLSKN